MPASALAPLAAVESNVTAPVPPAAEAAVACTAATIGNAK